MRVTERVRVKGVAENKYQASQHVHSSLATGWMDGWMDGVLVQWGE